MTTISLAPVVAFLREHGTLNVLEGAPVTGPARDSLILSALSRASLAEMAGPCNLRGSHLYLGADAICPAAEGWASRVLAMVYGMLVDDRAHLHIPPNSRVIWLLHPTTGARCWAWPDAPYTLDHQTTIMGGVIPSTPAGRLAAVLRYELERSR